MTQQNVMYGVRPNYYFWELVCHPHWGAVSPPSGREDTVGQGRCISCVGQVSVLECWLLLANAATSVPLQLVVHLLHSCRDINLFIVLASQLLLYSHTFKLTCFTEVCTWQPHCLFQGLKFCTTLTSSPSTPVHKPWQVLPRSLMSLCI